MTTLINLAVAFLLSLIAIQCLQRHGRFFLKGESFLLFLLMTGLFRAGGPVIAGFDISALRLLLWIALLGFALIYLRGNRILKRGPSIYPLFLYVLFLAWAVISLVLYSPDLIYGLRMFLKLLYPFLIMLLAFRVAIGEKIPAYLHLVFVSTLVLSIFNSGISEKIPYLVHNPVLKGVFWPRAPFADHAAIMVGIGLALWSTRFDNRLLLQPKVYYQGNRRVLRKFKWHFFKKWQYQLAVLWLCASPIAVASRTGLLATSGSIATFLAYKYKLKSIPFIAGIFFLGLWIVVYMPSFRELTFRDSRGVTIESVKAMETEDINSSGRFYMWGRLMDRFFYPAPLTGSGLGSVQSYMYKMAETPYGPFGRLKVPHSEYVALLCDLGLIGFGLYILIGLSALILAVKAAFSKVKVERVTGFVVASSFIALFCAMGFDNTFQYVLAVQQYPFAFLGMLLAIQGRPKKRFSNL